MKGHTDFYLTDEMVDSCGMNLNHSLGYWIQHKKKVKNIVSKRDAGLCFWCDQIIPRKSQTMDHIIPRSKGGLYTPDNMVLACKDCNTIRKDMDAAEFLTQQLEKQNDRPNKHD